MSDLAPVAVDASVTRRRNLKDHGREALRAIFRDSGLPAYRADQVLGWIYGKGVDEIAAMTDLPAPLRERLSAEWETGALTTRAIQRSVDGTRKLSLVTVDRHVIEAVLIPEERRNTLCVSTQVGCPARLFVLRDRGPRLHPQSPRLARSSIRC